MGIASKTTEVKYVLKGNKGAKMRMRSWAEGVEYLAGVGDEKFYDVVEYSGLLYLCIKSHTSAAGTNDPINSIAQQKGFWEDAQDWDFIATRLLLAEKIKADQIDVDNLYVKHLDGADGTFSGELKAATGTFSGSLEAATGTFSGDLKAAGGSFRGNIEITTAYNYKLLADSEFAEFRIDDESDRTAAALKGFSDYPGTSPELVLYSRNTGDSAELNVRQLSLGDVSGNFGIFSSSGIQFRESGNVFNGFTGSVSLGKDAVGRTRYLYFKNGISYKYD